MVKRVSHNVDQMVTVTKSNVRDVALPESSEDAYQTLVVEMPDAKKEAVLVILHGFTGTVQTVMYNEHTDTSIIDLNNWPELRCVYVQAPELYHPGLRADDYGGYYQNAWYKYLEDYGGEQEEKMDFPSIDITMKQLEKIIDAQVLELGIPRSQVFLAGYSQGSVTALWASTVLQPIGGILGLAGYQHSEATIPSPLLTPVMMINDKSDTVMEWTNRFCRELALDFKQTIEIIDPANVDYWFWIYLFVDENYPGHGFDRSWGVVRFLDYHLRSKSRDQDDAGLSWVEIPLPVPDDNADDQQWQSWIEEILLLD